MIAVIFEFTPAEGRFPEYLKLVGELKADLDKAEGFISLERFESITNKGKFVSLQFWKDEESVRKWRNLQKHREAQKRGRAGIFKSYRLRIAKVERRSPLSHGLASATQICYARQAPARAAAAGGDVGRKRTAAGGSHAARGACRSWPHL